MGGVTQQHPTWPTAVLRPGQHQRPGGARRAQRQCAGFTRRRLRQFRFELGRRHRHQCAGALGRAGPHQRIRHQRLRRIERQQGQHVGGAKPLVRHILVVTRAREPRRHRPLAIVEPFEPHAQRTASAGGLAFAQCRERRGHVGVDPRDMRREAQRGIQFALERRRVDDPGQRPDPLLPCTELDRCGWDVAAHAHVEHRGHRVRRQRIPDLEFTQQRLRSGIQREGTHVVVRLVRSSVITQRHRQAGATQHQGQRLAYRARAAHQNIKALHRVSL